MQVKVERVVENGDRSNVICQGVSGNVSNHCAQTVKCPVLIVKRPTSTAAPAAGTSRLREVMSMVDVVCPFQTVSQLCFMSLCSVDCVFVLFQCQLL
ncbi:hypothetical protein QQ045_022146 [Rhodiola kirilowii]